MKNERLLGITFAVITAVFWGILAIALKVSLKYFDLYSIIWFRFTFAFLSLFIFYSIKAPKQLVVLKKPNQATFLAAIFLTANYILYFKGLALTNAGNAQILIQSGPIILVLIGVFYFKEKLDLKAKIGFSLAVLGFSIFYRDQIIHLLDSRDYHQGSLFVLAGGLTWAIYAAFQKAALRNFSPQQINMFIYGIGSLCFLPFLDTKIFAMTDPFLWALIIFLGANTLIGYGAIGEAFKRIPANQVSIIITLNPLLTLFLMEIFYRLDVHWAIPEHTSWIGFIGAVILIIGAVVVVSRPKSPTK